MGQVLRLLGVFIVVLLVQIYVAQMLEVWGIRPDFLLVFLVYVSARLGRTTGILWGFAAGLFQDLTGSLSVLGANALAKSIVGYTAGTLNGNPAVWTPRIMNLYIYGSLLTHAVVYEVIMIMGFEAGPGVVLAKILLETLISGVMITGMRFLIPLMPSRA